MEELAIRQRLAELHEAVRSSSFLGLKSSSSQALAMLARPAQNCPIHESFDHVLLQLKYLIFDLEATRRENQYLREMLESRSQRDLEDTGDTA